MRFVGSVKVKPKIPESIARVHELAYNVWWAWNLEAQLLYQQIDSDLWSKSNHNPVKFLLEVTQEKLEKVSKEKRYLELYNKVFSHFDAYMKGEDTWFQKSFPDYSNQMIAYFSAEYGIHESLPIYSGGLGVLAGDHVKSASDNGLPFVAVGLLYKQGYFTQQINEEGWQEAAYHNLDFSQLPLMKALDSKGEQISIDVDLPGRKVYAFIWYIQVGRVRIYLLDTNVEKNKADDRWFTSQLYGGDQEMRITQEIILGMGGVKVLRALGLSPVVFHMNEGHSVFLGLERIKELVEKQNMGFYEALEVVKASTVFTTHTPVPAGNDAFPLNLQAKYFKSYWEKVKISESQFMDLGKEIEPNGYQIFSLTVLALKLSGRANGVSELHGHVSRKLWEKVWEGVPFEENLITHVTNGVNTCTWVALEIEELYEKHLGAHWRNRLSDRKFWEGVHNIPDEELWEVHQTLKKKTVDFIRRKAVEEWTRHGVSGFDVSESAHHLLNPDHLTIGFARRFATYKRAVLIFRNVERIKNILNHPEMPMQIVFAGKAHPKDKPGQEFIKNVFDIAKQEGFKGKIFFIEDYEMNVARHLIQGVDIWLNTPRRPYEASGTSGQKGPVNGVINFSVLDGWWREAFQINPLCGWSIGKDKDYPNTEVQDNEDALDIYSQLENEIIPLYYNRNEKGVPVGWVKRMKESIATVVPNFSTDRMVKDYTQKIYMSAMKQSLAFMEDNYKIGKKVSSWKNYIKALWNQVYIEPDSVTESDEYVETTLEEGYSVSAVIRIGGISPDDVRVELYYRKVDEKGNVIADNMTSPMKRKEDLGSGRFRYEGLLKPQNGGNYEYTVRIIPHNENLAHKHETGLIKWID
jgi:starch phosphorylase